MNTEPTIKPTGNSPADTSANLIVNGQACSVTVSARTQLAEVLRDHLHLTGTHLGCEHGVCGACTVLLDGRPVRSCITYAHGCEKANVVTVEGLRDDPLGGELRAAFSRHHALQCGFCTPGMLISAWDIITRLAPSDEATIRRELSGNLCRCTGHMGIVAAVREVALAHPGHLEATREIGADVAVDKQRAPFAPFDVDAAFVPVVGSAHAQAHSAITHSHGFNVVERSFTTAHPVAALWALFEDLPQVASCIPGVSVESAHGDHFSARATIRFGPSSATFAGEGTRTMDVAQRVGSIAGRGQDANGQATLDAQLRYSMAQADGINAADATTIAVSIRFRVQGGLAQFNRSDLVASFADVVLAQFTENCTRLLGGETLRTRSSMSGLALLWRMVKAKFSR